MNLRIHYGFGVAMVSLWVSSCHTWAIMVDADIVGRLGERVRDME